jgi:hypothetical protein
MRWESANRAELRIGIEPGTEVTPREQFFDWMEPLPVYINGVGFPRGQSIGDGEWSRWTHRMSGSGSAGRGVWGGF